MLGIERPRFRALRRRDVGGKITHEDKESDNADLGRIVNLMQYEHSLEASDMCSLALHRGDAYSVAHRFWMFSGFFIAPVRLTIALFFLYRYVHPAVPLTLVADSVACLY